MYPIRHHPIDRVYSADRGEDANAVLGNADFLVLTMRLTNATKGFIGALEFASMKHGARFINLARGALVDESALLEALESGQLGGAGLDTFSTEPLPANHSLWNAPNTLITPHFTPPQHDRTDRTIDIIAENVSRLMAGQALKNQLTQDDVLG